MMKLENITIAALLAFVSHAALAATTYYVATNGVVGASGTVDDPFPTIQEGLDAAVAKDVVVVADGVYEISSPLTCDVRITLKSASGNRDACIVDAKSRSACLQLSANNVVLSGMTFRNGYSSTSAGVKLSGVSATVSNVHVTGCSRIVTGNANGAGLQFGNYGTLYDSVIDNCELVDGQPIASATVLQLRGGGVSLSIGGLVRNTVVSNCSIRGYCDQTTYPQVGGGIFGYSTTVEDCTVMACSVSNTANAVDTPQSKCRGGFAGGVGLWRYSNQHDPVAMRNCLIVGNDASYQSAGAHFNGDGTIVEKCKFIGNVLRPIQAVYSGAGSAFGVLGTSVTVRNCQVVSNEISGKVSSSGGGAVACMSGTMSGTVMHDMLFEGNVGYYSSAFTCMASGVTVSNCVFRGNRPVTGQDSAVIYTFQSGRLLFTDCWLTDNVGNGFGALLNGYQSQAVTEAIVGVKFRNCLITRNTFPNSTSNGLLYWWVTKADYDNRLVLENCTIAGNLGSYVYSWTVLGRSATLGGNRIYCQGCVIVGNGKNGEQNFNATTSTALGHVQYTYTTGNVSTDPADANIIGTNPGFANAAAGDYRPASINSPLVDKVPAAGTWLAERRAYDLGDGTYNIAACGKYGVTITRNKPVRRLSGPAADIGCFEFYQPSGMLLFFK